MDVPGGPLFRINELSREETWERRNEVKKVYIVVTSSFVPRSRQTQVHEKRDTENSILHPGLNTNTEKDSFKDTIRLEARTR